MALIDRVTGVEEPKISPHALYGLMREFARGEINKQFIIDNLGLTVDDTTDLDWLIAIYQLQGSASAKELWMQGMWGIILIAEIGFPGYVTQAEVKSKIQSLTVL